MKNILFISYSFPPNGGSGVQRIVKFVKYLNHYGINSDVITSNILKKNTVDLSLNNDIPNEVNVYRTKSLDPLRFVSFIDNKRDVKKDVNKKSSKVKSYLIFKLLKTLRSIRNMFIFPDLYAGWIPFSFYKAYRLLNKQSNYSVIITSLPFYSNAITGYLVSKMSNKPLILDFRDGWIDDPYLIKPTKLHYYLHKKLENIIVNHAEIIVVYGNYLKDIFNDRYPSKKVVTILNGFDPEDINNANKILKEDNNKIRFVYTGKIFNYHRKFIDLLFKAIKEFNSSNKFNDKQIEVIFVGDIECSSYHVLKNKYNVNDYVKEVGYVQHLKSIGYLKGADYLLFALPPEDISSYSGKIFEYLAVKKPIISFINKNGIAANLLNEYGHGDLITNYDSNKILDVFNNVMCNNYDHLSFENLNLKRINRQDQAYELSLLINEVSSFD